MTDAATPNEANREVESDDGGDSDDERYESFFESIRSETGLEIGIKVTWPGVEPAIELSTCLDEQEIAPMFHGTQWAGTRVWRAAVVALQYLQQSSSVTGINISEDSTVLELGCGLGVPGILLNRLLLCSVVLTDMDTLVPQLRQNLTSNDLTLEKQKIQAQPLDWSVKGLQELLKMTQLSQFDIVLNCDCIYEPLYGESWKLLLQVQEELLRINPDTVMLTSVERRKFDNVEHYLQGLHDSSIVSKVEKVRIDFGYPHEVELYRIYGVN